ncbi:MAG: PD-(D/E)XK nuclease family protein [Planctomycetota bacterium]
MPHERHFLGWHEPVLPTAAAWLRERFGPAMGEVLVAVPTARAGRRLVELLAETIDGPWTPPQVITVGGLPERLIHTPGDVADELEALLARAASLREADAELLGRVAPHPPAADDAVGWTRLAETFAEVSRDLAAARLTPRHVVEMAERARVDLGLGVERWAALAELEAAYHDTLGRPDRDAARRQALRDQAIDVPGAGVVVMLAVIDPTPIVVGLLELVADVAVLVPAPAEHAEGFTAFGAVVPGYWESRPALVDEPVLVDGPRDQSAEVVRRLAALPAGTSVEAVSLGLGDESAAGPIGRVLELAGVPTRPAAGRAVSRSAPAVLLQTLGRFADGRRFADLAALARHPELAAWLGDDEPWITRLDEHAQRTLQSRVDEPAPHRDGEPFGVVGHLVERIAELLPEQPDTPRPLPEWAEPIADVLRIVYGHRRLDRHDDPHLVEALGAIAATLRSLAELDPQAATTPRLTFSQAVAFANSRWASARSPEPGGTPAVELMGFLDLPWDDTLFAVVTDVNEGLLPASRTVDAFLPDTLRRALDTPDDALRLARDTVLMNIVTKTRQGSGRGATVIACRRSAEGDPRTPSRLLLAGAGERLAPRLRDFFREDPAEPATTVVAAPTPGGRSRFLIPPPQFDQPVLDRLSVTRFRDFLACRYRFYLKHVLKLHAIDDRAAELDPRAFGNLAHDVLAGFAKSPLAHADDPRPIAEWLNGRLTEKADHAYGRRPAAAVRIQVERLRERLDRFAAVQAAQVRDGWRIDADSVEASLESAIDVDGIPFTVHGRIDRLDRHADGRVRLLDYKTRDLTDAKRLAPDAVHRRGGEWVDLQLPLYRALAADHGLPNAEVGYLNLGVGASTSGLFLAGWSDDEYAGALAVRDRVIRELREQKFWPPSDPPMFDDGLRRVAVDLHLERNGLISASGPDGGAT